VSLFEGTEREAHAAGDYDSESFAALRDRLERLIDPNMLDVVNAELRVLETMPPPLRDAQSDLPLKELLAEPEILSAGVETTPTSRRTQVDTFLQNCNTLSRVRIRRRHLWLSAGHSSGRQFEYWQRSDRRATGADEHNFGRILRMRPGDFLALLQQKHLSEDQD
jgi:hypothetical protein